jgi:hypothetical protein
MGFPFKHLEKSIQNREKTKQKFPFRAAKIRKLSHVIDPSKPKPTNQNTPLLPI